MYPSSSFFCIQDMNHNSCSCIFVPVWSVSYSDRADVSNVSKRMGIGIKAWLAAVNSLSFAEALLKSCCASDTMLADARSPVALTSYPAKTAVLLVERFRRLAVVEISLTSVQAVTSRPSLFLRIDSLARIVTNKRYFLVVVPFLMNALLRMMRYEPVFGSLI